jgi:hypothetical protein
MTSVASANRLNQGPRSARSHQQSEQTGLPLLGPATDGQMGDQVIPQGGWIPSRPAAGRGEQ